MDPGAHVVTAQAPGGAPTSLQFTLAPGDRKTFQLTLPAPAKGSSTRRRVAFVVGGIGVAWLACEAKVGGG